MDFQALAIGLLGPSGVSKGRCRFENRHRPLETFGGAHWAVPKSDDPPAPHFINLQFATLVNQRRPLISLEEHFRVMQKEQRSLLRIF